MIMDLNIINVSQEGEAEVPDVNRMLVEKKIDKGVFEKGNIVYLDKSSLNSDVSRKQFYLFPVGHRTENSELGSYNAAYWLVGTRDEFRAAYRIVYKSRKELHGKTKDLTRYGSEWSDTGNCYDWLPQTWGKDAFAEGNLDLFWVYDDVRSRCPYTSDENEIRENTMKILASLIEKRILVPASRESNGQFHQWNGNSISQIEDIKKAWGKLGHSLKHDEIVWFVPGHF